MKSEVAGRIKEQVGHIKDVYERGRKSALDLSEAASATSVQAARQTDEWVHDNSWKLLGMTLALGLVLGLIFSGGGRERLPERLPR